MKTENKARHFYTICQSTRWPDGRSIEQLPHSTGSSIFLLENSMHRRLQALSSLQKSVQKMPVLDFVVWGPVLVICEHTWYADTITSSGSIRVSQPQIVIRRQPRRFDEKDTLTTSQNVTFRCHKSDGSKYQFCAWHGPNMDSGQDCTLRQECGWTH